MTALVALATLAGCGKHDLRVLGLQAACKAGMMKACDAAYAPGCYELARCYDFGVGVAQDFKKAAALYRKACADGLPGACNHQVWDPTTRRQRGAWPRASAFISLLP